MIKQGSYKISSDDYHNDPCPEPSLSRGTIIDLLDSPARAFYNHPRLNPVPKEEKDESKFDQGSAAHDLLLEGGKKIFIVSGFDDWKKKDAHEARKAARKSSYIPLLQKQFDLVYAMTEAAKTQIKECSDIGVGDLSAEGEGELSYIWMESNGVWCRCRPDWIKKDRTLILDYKTTGTSVNPDKFSGNINEMGYPIQSVFYRRGVETIEKKKPNFFFVAQEDKPPYFCSFHGIDFQNEDMAQEKVSFSIDLWGKCLKYDKWPGYPKRICYAEPKPWDLAAWEMKKNQQIMEDVA